MDDQKQQLIDRIKQAQNVLVTVSSNPSVDQLAAAIGLTLVLNHLNKHGTAVFSGEVPSTLEFLKPEETLEKNTDSLRDFIIALDKSKADKLRYKVEDQVVRIFITPYRTSISDKDLDFSQGDFNVDVVVALGVTEQNDLDGAITAHGRILHDATVASLSTTTSQGSLGSINWVDTSASSLSEMVVALADGLDKKAVDAQVATALLTGIVAVTERFRNEKTSPATMSVSAELMAAGANQQLIASELEHVLEVAEPEPEKSEEDMPTTEAAPVDAPKKAEPGTLEISHDGTASDEAAEPDDVEEPTQPEEPEEPTNDIHVAEDGTFTSPGTEELPQVEPVDDLPADGEVTEHEDQEPKTEVHRERLTEPPTMNNGSLTANSGPELFDPPTETLSQPPAQTPLLRHGGGSEPAADTPVDAAAVEPAPLPPPPAPPVSLPEPAPAQPHIAPDETLAEIEQAVGSPHVHATDEPADSAVDTVDDARNAVEAALNGATSSASDPIVALNAQPLGPELHAAPALTPAPFMSEPPASQTSYPNAGFSEPTPGNSPADESLDMPVPTSAFPALPQTPSAFPGAAAQTGNSPTPPPPVPPPMLPPLQ